MTKKYNLKSKITSSLRKLWFYSPARRECVKRAKDNGNKCERCNITQEKLEIDHKVAVANVKGWDGWDNYIERLFVDANGLTALCTYCHKSRTTVQNEQRKKYRAINKGKK